MTTMKAIVQDQFGSPDVLQLRDIDTPAVGNNEVLVRIRAASANPWDWHFMRALPYIARPQAGWRKPKNPILGSDMAGEVEATGQGVTRFKPGDEVFGFVGAGAFAEYVSVSEDVVELKPTNLGFQLAAAVPLPAMTALQGLRDVGHIQAGQKVLIVGASGGVGTFAVQLAKWFGADVTGVCSTRSLDLVRSIGADQVIDYTQEDFTRGGEKFDLIFQLAGTTSASACRRALAPKGTLVLSSGDSPGRIIGPMARVIRALLLSPFVGQTLRPLTFKRSSEDLQFLRKLIEAGNVTPVIDRMFPLSESADAIRHLETGHPRGKVVIAVSPMYPEPELHETLQEQGVNARIGTGRGA